MERTYKSIYEDIYRLHAKFGRTPSSDRADEYWRDVVTEVGAYSTAHGDQFTTDLLVAIVKELEREHRERQHEPQRN